MTRDRSLIFSLALGLLSLSLEAKPLKLTKKTPRVATLSRHPASAAVPTIREKASAHRMDAPSTVFSILTGLNFSYGRTNPSQEGTTRNSFGALMTLERHVTGSFFIESGVGYTQRGVNANLGSFAGYNIVGQISLNYLEVPVFLKMKMPLASPKLRAFVSAGPSFGLAIKRQVDILGVVDIDLSNRFTTADLVVSANMGLQYDLAPGVGVTGMLRNDFGVIDIDSSDTDYYTRGHQLLFGLLFDL